VVPLALILGELVRETGPTVEQHNTDNLTWRKSSYSGSNGGDCVEIAVLSDDGRAVRDSKDPGGPVADVRAG
jgi:hypothetical protein